MWFQFTGGIAEKKTSNPKGKNQRIRAAELSRKRSKTTATLTGHCRVQERGKRGMNLWAMHRSAVRFGTGGKRATRVPFSNGQWCLAAQAVPSLAGMQEAEGNHGAVMGHWCGGQSNRLFWSSACLKENGIKEPALMGFWVSNLSFVTKCLHGKHSCQKESWGDPFAFPREEKEDKVWKRHQELNLSERDLNVTPVFCVSLRHSLKKSQLYFRRIGASHVVIHHVAHETPTLTPKLWVNLVLSSRMVISSLGWWLLKAAWKWLSPRQLNFYTSVQKQQRRWEGKLIVPGDSA